MRLSCIVMLLTVLLTPTVCAQKDPRYGAFQYVSSKDEMDDSDRSYVFTVALNPSPMRTASLGWKCFSEGLRVILILGKYYAGDSDDEIQVQYRFDTDPASDVVYWPLFPTKKAAQLPATETESFTERAKRAKKVVIRTSDPLDGETHTDEFSLNGLTAALNRVGSCTQK